MKYVSPITIILSLFFGSVYSYADNTEEASSPVEVIQSLPQVTLNQAHVVLCFSREEIRKGDVRVFQNLEDIRTLDPGAIDENDEETCVNTAVVKNAVEQLAFLKSSMENRHSLTLEVYKPTMVEGGPEKLAGPYKDLKFKDKVRLTFRGAIAGAVGAAAFHLARSGFDRLSNKGSQSSISLAKGALIGGIIDVLQRVTGSTDEPKILANDAAAAFVGGMIGTNDPNVAGAGVIFTLLNTSVVERELDKWSDKLPKKLAWQIPIGFAVAIAVLHKTNKNEKFISGNHMPGMVGYGVLGGYLSAKTGNENVATIVATGIALADEMCDMTKKICKGRGSAMDLLTASLGGMLGVKLSSALLPPGLFMSAYRKGLAMTYFRQW